MKIAVLAIGLPGVGPDQGGPKDLIIYGVSGFVTRALDEEDFAARVLEWLATVQDRDWAQAGRRFWATPRVGG